MTCHKPHPGPHRLMWFHTWGPDGKRYLEYVEAALPSAGEEAIDNPEFDDIRAAMPTVRTVLERAKRQAAADELAYQTGLEVDDAELAAIRLVVEEACEYMAINRYDEEDDEDAETAQALADGSVAYACLAGVPGWFKAVTGTDHYRAFGAARYDIDKTH